MLSQRGAWALNQIHGYHIQFLLLNELEPSKSLYLTDFFLTQDVNIYVCPEITMRMAGVLYVEVLCKMLCKSEGFQVTSVPKYEIPLTTWDSRWKRI